MSQFRRTTRRGSTRRHRTLFPACEALERRDLLATFTSRFVHAPHILPAGDIRAAEIPDRAEFAVARPAASAKARAAALNQAMQRVMDEFNVPGAVAGVIAPGKRPWMAARGLADVADGQPMTVNDKFQVRSVA